MLAVIYLALLLLTSLPAFQRWSAGVASDFLEEKVGSKVSINNLKLNMLGRVVLDNVKIFDRRDTLMLQASRIAAKVDLMPLIEKKIRISGAQLIGAKAIIYKDGDEPFNFQYFVDAFSKKDTTSTPLDLAIGALVVRRGDIRFDKTPSGSPLKGQRTDKRSFDPNHLHLSDLNLTARVYFKKPDSLAIDLRNLSFKEQSGLHLQHLSFEAAAGKHSASVRDFLLKLPNTNITSQTLSYSPLKGEKMGQEVSPLRGDLVGSLNGSVCPRDLSCFVPKLANFGDVINLSTEVKLANNILRLPNLSVKDNGSNISLVCDVTVQDIKDNPSLFADIKELRTGAALQQFLTENLEGIASPNPSKGGENRHSGSPLLWRD